MSFLINALKRTQKQRGLYIKVNPMMRYSQCWADGLWVSEGPVSNSVVGCQWLVTCR